MNSTTLPRAIGKILLLQLFHMYGFGIKYPTKVDTPLNKETKTNPLKKIIFLYVNLIILTLVYQT